MDSILSRYLDPGYLILALLLLGLWGLLQKRNLIKKVIALNIMNSAVIVFFLYEGEGSIPGKSAPILVDGVTNIVDPLPQALMLTAIVVGVCITALALVLVYLMYQRYHTLDITNIESQVFQEHE
jgi:multicomponent Na+:H+ antiporter subunit C